VPLRRKESVLFMPLEVVELHADGACSGNPGPGSWAVALVCRGKMKKLSGFVPDTTNNRMEMTAVIEGLKAMKRPVNVTVFSDSKYVICTMSDGWKRGVNKDLWEEMDKVVAPHKVEWVWIKGHNGNFFNDLVDSMCCEVLKQNGVKDFFKCTASIPH
jgi:ribonuclease HI